jgi:hypothetical protein
MKYTGLRLKIPNGDSRECGDDLPPGDHDWEDSL